MPCAVQGSFLILSLNLTVASSFLGGLSTLSGPHKNMAFVESQTSAVLAWSLRCQTKRLAVSLLGNFANQRGGGLQKGYVCRIVVYRVSMLMRGRVESCFGLGLPSYCKANLLLFLVRVPSYALKLVEETNKTHKISTHPPLIPKLLYPANKTREAPLL